MTLNLRQERFYANDALTWSHGFKTEDELLQRIWNLSELSLKACDEIEELREKLREYGPFCPCGHPASSHPPVWSIAGDASTDCLECDCRDYDGPPVE